MAHPTHAGFGIFDADNHYYEPRDAFTRHLDPRFAERAVKVVKYPDYLPAGTPGDAIRRMMRDNARELLGLDASRPKPGAQ